MQCPIQAENSSDIGWLAYTSQFSDKDYITKQLEKAVGHEMGVRLAAIANRSEQKLEWRKKTRALIVVAPTETAQTAKDLLSKFFHERKRMNQNNENPVLDVFHTLAFLPLEQDISKMPNCGTNYAICLQRHQIYH